VTRRRWLTLAIIAGLTVASAVLTRSQDTSPPLNVVVIVWDTVRADRLSLYGHDRPTTPAMAQLAKESRVFDRAYSPAIWTVPSHASLFTGRSVTEHGATVKHRWLSDDFTTIAEWLGKEGYDTYAWSSNPNLDPDSVNLLQGFESVDTSWEDAWGHASVKQARAKRIPRDRSTEISLGFVDGPSDDDDMYRWSASPVAADSFGQWLAQRKDKQKPFFAFLNLMEAHRPRIPSMAARKAALESNTSVIEAGLATECTEAQERAYLFDKHQYTDAELAGIRGVYDASLRELDRSTRDVLRGLKRRGLLEHTVFVFTSDHGEALGEHQLMDHFYGMYEPLVHVPLLIRAPRLAPGRVSHPVSTSQLFATLGGLLNLPLPETATVVDGLLADAAPVYAEFTAARPKRFDDLVAKHPDVDPTARFVPAAAVLQGQDKLIAYEDGRVELFDVVLDPSESFDLSGIEDTRREELLQQLENWRATREVYRPPAETYVEDELNPLLRALGYVD
jgi:arylsulfatase A-like enzyme